MTASVKGLDEADIFIRTLGATTSQALSDTLNDLAEQAKTTATKSILNDLNLPRNYIEEKLTVENATKKNLTAKVRSLSRGILLSRFDAKTLTIGGKRNGVSVRVKQRTVKMKKAFMLTGKNGNKLVAIRQGKGRNNFKVLYGPSVSQAFKVIQDPISQHVRNNFISTFNKNLQQTIK